MTVKDSGYIAFDLLDLVVKAQREIVTIYFILLVHLYRLFAVVIFVATPALSIKLLSKSTLPFNLFRDQADQLDGDISGPWKSTDFKPQLDELQHLLDALNGLYNAKKNALINSVTENNKGQQE